MPLTTLPRDRTGEPIQIMRPGEGAIIPVAGQTATTATRTFSGNSLRFHLKGFATEAVEAFVHVRFEAQASVATAATTDALTLEPGPPEYLGYSPGAEICVIGTHSTATGTLYVVAGA